MKKFITDSGKTISAQTLADAQSLADQYGMGKIVSTQKVVVKKDVVRNGNFALWNNWCQSVEQIGGFMSVVAGLYDNPDLQMVWYGNGKPEKLNKPEYALMHKMLRDAG